jgi:uncharacterized phage infection (PIP) family protein YhgE
MVSGRETLSQIERSIEDLRRQEQQLMREVEGITAHHVRLLEQRTDAYRELAEVRIRSAVSDGVINEADALHHQVESLMKARQVSIDQLKARKTAADEKRGEANARAEALRSELEGLETRLDAIASTALRELASEPSYKALVEARDKAKEILAKAADKAKQAENDRERKGAAYETDPLFMYLWKRRYGSKDYHPNWLIHLGDDWIAKLVGYSDARANYAMLNEIPDRLAEHVAQLRNDLEDVNGSVDRAETDRINRVAGTDLVSAIAEARSQQVEINKELESAEAEIAEISQQLVRYAEGRDDSFREAVKLYTPFLEQESYERLTVLARRTPEPTDDRIVERIGEIDRKAKDLVETIAQRRKDLDHVAARRKELIEVAQKYRRSYYDDIGSEFELNDIVENALEELIKGAITGADYWARTQRRQRWKSRPADPFRKSYGFPPFGSGGGGGRSRGGFHTGGSF